MDSILRLRYALLYGLVGYTEELISRPSKPDYDFEARAPTQEPVHAALMRQILEGLADPKHEGSSTPSHTQSPRSDAPLVRFGQGGSLMLP